MTNPKDHPAESVASGDAAGEPAADRLDFDATTNFSILGWLLDRFGKRAGDRQRVDMKLK